MAWFRESLSPKYNDCKKIWISLACAALCSAYYLVETNLSNSSRYWIHRYHMWWLSHRHTAATMVTKSSLTTISIPSKPWSHFALTKHAKMSHATEQGCQWLVIQNLSISRVYYNSVWVVLSALFFTCISYTKNPLSGRKSPKVAEVFEPTALWAIATASLRLVLTFEDKLHLVWL